MEMQSTADSGFSHHCIVNCIHNPLLYYPLNHLLQIAKFLLNMNTSFFHFISLIAISFSAMAQELKPISLLPPNLKREATLMQTLAKRASGRAFKDTLLSDQDLSDLLWAANGVNRPEKIGRTASSAMNAQDIDIYVIRIDGIYMYDAKKHVLNSVQKGDFRSQIGGQDFVATAPVNLILVSELSRFKNGDDTQKATWAAIDAGIVSQNISLFCTAAGLGTVPRSMINIEKMRTVLKLKNSQFILLNHPVGFIK